MVSRFANLWEHKKWGSDTATQPLSLNQEIKRKQPNAVSGYKHRTSWIQSGWNDSIGPETEDTTNMFLLNADWIQNVIKAEQSRGRPELSQ